MNLRPIFLVCLFFITGCGRSDPRSPGAAVGPEPVQITRWSDRTELFLEFPPLVKGQTSRFAVHLTSLGDFKPMAQGKVQVEVIRKGGPAETFAAERSSRPGIFSVDVRMDQPGAYDLLIRLSASGLAETHELGSVRVHESERDAAGAPREAPAQNTITFLKEQQWNLDFATEIVRERSHRASLRVPAEIEPRTGGVAEVTVPFAARLVGMGQWPAQGTTVLQGQVLGGLVPPTSNPADLPALELQRAEADAALELARKERSRLERLLEVGAVPLRRLEEARSVETTAAARLKAAQARIAHYEATRAAEGASSPGAGVFLLRAPISGVIADTHATSGANVEVGENLFRIVDVDRVYVAGKIPETDAARIRRISGAELEVTGIPEPLSTGRLISIGRIVDPRSRTVKVIFEAPNRGRWLAVGQAVFLRLFMPERTTAPAVPDVAVTDDAGQPIVYVQIAGESFVRRPVKIGPRAGGYVQILEGIVPGERIVSRGAYLIRLATLSGQLPAHGHVH